MSESWNEVTKLFTGQITLTDSTVHPVTGTLAVFFKDNCQRKWGGQIEMTDFTPPPNETWYMSIDKLVITEGNLQGNVHIEYITAGNEQRPCILTFKGKGFLIAANGLPYIPDI